MSSSPWKRGGIALGTAVGTAGLAYAVPRLLAAPVRRRREPDGDPLEMPECDVNYVESFDGSRLRVLSRGDGPVVLLSHGVLLSAQTWVRQFRTWPELGYRVVAFDHRGHGESTVGASGHAIEHLADDIRVLLARLDLREVTLVGHSMGGFAVQAFAVRFPELAREHVRGLVLLSTSARTPLASGLPAARSIMHLIARSGPDATRVLSRRDLGFAIARMGLGRRPYAAHVEFTRRILTETDPAAARDAVLSLLDFDLRPDLGRISQPTLVIVGSADILTPPWEARRMARAIPGARYEVVPGAGHMLMLERAPEFGDLVLGFAADPGAPIGADQTR